MKKYSLAERAHNALLMLYPRRFRHVFGEELRQAFRLRLRRRSRGWLRFWVDTLLDVMWNATAVRFRPTIAVRPYTLKDSRQVPFFMRDVRLSLRLFRKQLGFSVVVVFTLALGIGANTALFTVLNGVLLSPLPYESPDDLIRVWENDTNEGTERGNMSPADYFDYKEQNQTLQSFGAFSTGSAVWYSEGDPERIVVQGVTTEVLDILGVPALLGRTFKPTDDVTANGRLAVLSYGFWQQRFGADSAVIGNDIRLGSNTYQIVGVMPQHFRAFSGAPELWVPSRLDSDDRTVRSVHYLRTVGRLRFDVTLADARADLLAVARRLEADYPNDNTGHLVTILSLEDSIVGSVRNGLWLMMAAVGFVLLVTCANLANLFLTRGIDRQREFALRSALGASRGQIVKQLFTENMLLATLGGLVGVAIAYGGVDVFLALDPGAVPRIETVQVGGASLVFAFSLAVGTAILFGIAPAFVLSRYNVVRGIREMSSSVTQSSRMQRWRDLLAVLQLALAITLLVSAGLLVRSFDRLQRVDPGFESSGLLIGQIALPGRRYPNTDDIARFQHELFSNLELSPRIIRAGSVTFPPFSDESSTAWLTLVDRPPVDGIPPEVNIINVSGKNYFEVMGVSLVSGRMFDERDRADSPRVTVINQAAAREFWPNEDPVGKQVRLGPNPEATPFEIIGVVSDMRQFGLDEEPYPASFSLSAQGAWSGFSIVVRTTGDPFASAGHIKGQVRAMDAELVVSDLMTMDEMIGISVARPRFASWLVGSFALIALCIATVGIYGVMAYSVTQRRQEIGVRMALGAGRARVLGLVLRRGLMLALFGLVIGMMVAVIGARFLQNLLFGITMFDPVTFIAVPVLLVSASLAASYLPAMRAARLSPVRALRSD